MTKHDTEEWGSASFLQPRTGVPLLEQSLKDHVAYQRKNLRLQLTSFNFEKITEFPCYVAQVCVKVLTEVALTIHVMGEAKGSVCMFPTIRTCLQTLHKYDNQHCLNVT